MDLLDPQDSNALVLADPPKQDFSNFPKVEFKGAKPSYKKKDSIFQEWLLELLKMEKLDMQMLMEFNQ